MEGKSTIFKKIIGHYDSIIDLTTYEEQPESVCLMAVRQRAESLKDVKEQTERICL